MTICFVGTLVTSGAVWMIGSDRIQAVAAYDGAFFPWFGVFNRRFGTPVRVNVMSGIVSTVFCFSAIAFFDSGDERDVPDRPRHRDLDDADLVHLDLPGRAEAALHAPGRRAAVSRAVRHSRHLDRLAADHGLGPARLVGRGLPGHAREGARRPLRLRRQLGRRARPVRGLHAGDARRSSSPSASSATRRAATSASRSSRWRASAPSRPRPCPRSSPRRAVRVWRIPYSTNCERVALAAGRAGAERRVDRRRRAYDRTPCSEVSGQKRVPVAEIDGEIVVGSLAIVGRIAPTLWPAEPARTRRGRGVPRVARPRLDASARRRLLAHPRRRRRRRADRAGGGSPRRALRTASRRCSTAATISSATSCRSPTSRRIRSSSTRPTAHPATTTRFTSRCGGCSVGRRPAARRGVDRARRGARPRVA